ncbi:hypothetical protein CBR_g63081 [Chara braunii]|uniref:Uncharacterized protein n=1 Tax=Chara braunii TaxID=69332 RepID=A0A388K8W1_CHABU|nr:hypothetical protein CBR_g63081 [Chara braunii]|eukprot:GBG66498.1 hypothetical protein CBR_g63081 [Chara braunii]
MFRTSLAPLIAPSSLLLHFSKLTPSSKGRLVDSLSTNLSVLNPSIASLGNCASRTPLNGDNGAATADVVQSHRNAFKIYTYFLHCIVEAGERDETKKDNDSGQASAAGRRKGKTSKNRDTLHGWNWDSMRGKVIKPIAMALENDLRPLFRGNPDEGLVAVLAKTAFSLLEKPTVCSDSSLKADVFGIILNCALRFGYLVPTTSQLIHLLHKHDHLSGHISDLLVLADKKFNDSRLLGAVLGEIGRIDSKYYVRDTTGAQNVATFLGDVTEKLPKGVARNLSVLMVHFDGEAHQMRSALVGAIGRIIARAYSGSGPAIGDQGALRSKQGLLDVLVERLRDTSAYTRGKVLQTWAYLCEENAVPLGHLNHVAELGAGRLRDKAAMVRKSALQLLGTLLQQNPFGPTLSTTTFEATLAIYKKKLADMLEAEKQREDGNGTERGGTGEDPFCEKNDVLDGTTSADKPNTCQNGDDQQPVDSVSGGPAERDNHDASKVSDAGTSCPDTQYPDSQATQPEDSVESRSTTLTESDIGGVDQTRALVASLESALAFSSCFANIMPVLGELLTSSATTDVIKTIHLLVIAHAFSIDDSNLCLRKMLPLIFCQESSVRDAVLEAFVSLYLSKHPVESARNLIELVLGATVGDLAALESIIISLMKNGIVHYDTIRSLWDVFSFKLAGVTPVQSRGALIVLAMAAKGKPEIVCNRLQCLIDIGFGHRAREDGLLARYACLTIQRMSLKDKEKLTSNHKVFSALSGIIVASPLPESSWYSAAEQAINTIYCLHPMPERICAQLLHRLMVSTFRIGSNGEQQQEGQWLSSPEERQMGTCAEDLKSPSDGSGKGVGSIKNAKARVIPLSRFLFVVGHVALKHLVYVENAAKVVRRQRADKEKARAQSEADQQDADLEAGVPASGGISNGKENGAAEDELGIGVESQIEDAALDALQEKTEKQIVSSANGKSYLISAIAPIVSCLCRNNGILQQFPALRPSAILALCKLMAVDAKFCEDNLQLLFTVARTAEEAGVRSNCVIALGDLAFRFPNLVEPWTEHMYACLYDECPSVRKNAVLVLTHLILNDMMKLFFTELSKKGHNPIYNLLPDMLSRLSSNPKVSQETFRHIMLFLMGFIKKEKQLDGLIEKLCHRFPAARDLRQWRDIAYCLSLLSFSEKGVKKLIDMFKLYKDCLGDEEVVEHFKSIVGKVKKFAKPELKTVLEGFDEKLIDCHKTKREEAEAVRNAGRHEQLKVGRNHTQAKEKSDIGPASGVTLARESSDMVGERPQASDDRTSGEEAGGRDPCEGQSELSGCESIAQPANEGMTDNESSAVHNGCHKPADGVDADVVDQPENSMAHHEDRRSSCSGSVFMSRGPDGSDTDEDDNDYGGGGGPHRADSSCSGTVRKSRGGSRGGLRQWPGRAGGGVCGRKEDVQATDTCSEGIFQQRSTSLKEGKATDVSVGELTVNAAGSAELWLGPEGEGLTRNKKKAEDEELEPNGDRVAKVKACTTNENPLLHHKDSLQARRFMSAKEQETGKTMTHGRKQSGDAQTQAHCNTQEGSSFVIASPRCGDEHHVRRNKEMAAEAQLQMDASGEGMSCSKEEPVRHGSSQCSHSTVDDVLDKLYGRCEVSAESRDESAKSVCNLREKTVLAGRGWDSNAYTIAVGMPVFPCEAATAAASIGCSPPTVDT